MEIFAVVITFILVLGFSFLLGLMWWKIFKKAGYPGALGLLMLVPLANILMFAILAFSEWPIHKEKTNLNAGAVKPRKSMPAPLIAAIVIATIVGVLFLIGLIAAVAFPSFLKARIKANEAAAESTVKTISTAIESYNLEKGNYPSEENDLLSPGSPYLTGSFNSKTILGYTYQLELSSDGYEISAAPKECHVTGSKTFQVSTNGIEFQKECDK